MRDAAISAPVAAARFYTPLIALFALVLLVVRPAGVGVGLLAGLGFGLALLIHALVFGAAAARAAAPPLLARMLAALGLATVVVAYASPRLLFQHELIEGGLFAMTAAGAALVIAVLFGRAPTMRDHS